MAQVGTYDTCTLLYFTLLYFTLLYFTLRMAHIPTYMTYMVYGRRSLAIGIEGLGEHVVKSCEMIKQVLPEIVPYQVRPAPLLFYIHQLVCRSCRALWMRVDERGCAWMRKGCIFITDPLPQLV